LHCDRHYLVMFFANVDGSDGASDSIVRTILKSAHDRFFSDREVAGTLGRPRHTSAAEVIVDSFTFRGCESSAKSLDMHNSRPRCHLSSQRSPIGRDTCRRLIPLSHAIAKYRLRMAAAIYLIGRLLGMGETFPF